VKELTALHGAAHILQPARADCHGVLREFAALLPPAMQYPEVTAARVRLGEVVYATPGFLDTLPMLRAEFGLATGQHGSLEVVYTEARPQAGEGPFLTEERALLDSLADMLRTACDRRQATEALQKNADEISDLYNHAPCGYHVLDKDGVLVQINDTELAWL